MGASILASTIFGMPVAVDGVGEQLRDLGVVRAGDSWRVVAVRTHRRDATLVRWSREGILATADGDAGEVIWLREALFDRQIVDLEGRRVIRVGDVVLRGTGELLEVAGVEVGAAAVLRRLGLRRLAARLRSQQLPIDRLLVASAPAGGLLLDAPASSSSGWIPRRLPTSLRGCRCRWPRGPSDGRGTAVRWRTTLASAVAADGIGGRSGEAFADRGVLRGARSRHPRRVVGRRSRGITTYSIVGADHGYALIWVLVLATAMLILYHLIAVRVGAVTGQGLAGLVRERFGVRTALAMTTILVVANLGTTAAEFAGIASALDLAGVSRIVSVPIAAVGISWLVIGSQFKRVEHVLLVLAATLGAYVLAGSLAGPDWSAAAHGAVVPSLSLGRADVLVITATVGTTIAPWGLAFIQSYAVDKRLRPEDLGLERVDVIAGAILTGVIGFFVVIACAATLHVSGRSIHDARDAPSPWSPWRAPGRRGSSERACSARASSAWRSCRSRRPIRSRRRSAPTRASTTRSVRRAPSTAPTSG